MRLRESDPNRAEAILGSEGSRFDYVFVLLLIYLSGSIFFISFHYQMAVIATAALSLMMFVWRSGPVGLVFDPATLARLLLFGALISATCLFNEGANLGSHVAVFLQFCIAALAVQIISYRRFVYVTSVLMGLLAGVSLVFFFGGLVFPSLVQLLPRTEALVSVDYYNALVHVFAAPVGYGDFVLARRNGGIFWEPGAYQAFLNVALFWLLDDSVFGGMSARKRRMFVAAMVLAVITTVSVSGYVLLGVVLVSRAGALRRIIPRGWAGLFGLGLLAVFSSYSVADLIGSGFQRYISGDGDVVSRLSLSRVSEIGSDGTRFLFGTSFRADGAEAGSVWNSIVDTAIRLGVPFTLLLAWNYVRGARVMTGQVWVLVSVLLVSFSTESLFWRPFWLYIAFATSSASSSAARDGMRVGEDASGAGVPRMGS